MAQNEDTQGVESAPEHPSEDRLRQYALGLLPEGDLIRCAEHLESCHTCRKFASAVQNDGLVTLLQHTSLADSTILTTAGPLRLQRGFELIEEIGRGGMAVVFKAHQRDLGRTVALKQIKPEMMSADGLFRFRQEAGILARIQHPNIIQIYDVGEQDGRPDIAFEYVAGGNLDQQLRGNPLPTRSACQLVATLAKAVRVAHEQSIIHRDLKPSNVLLALSQELSVSSSDERFWTGVIPKIGDFGLSKHIDQPQARTYTGEILGTPGYMSPEQAQGETDKIGPATDIFSLGVILYETLTGRRPFVGTSIVQTLESICTADPVPPSHWQPRLSADLDIVCLKCLEKEARRRYATAADLADDLERWLAGEPIRARPVSEIERIWKWVRRNPAKGTLIAGTVLLILSITFGVLLHNRRLQAAVKRAKTNEAIALENFRRGHDVVHKMIEDVADMSVDTESWKRLRENLYARAREYHSRPLEGADDSNPDVRLARTMALIYRGSMHVILGEHREAIQELSNAQQQLESILRENPEHTEVRSNLARCYRNLGWAHAGVSEFSAAEEDYQQSLEHLALLVAARPEDVGLLRRLAGLNGDIGSLYFLTDRRNLAEQAYRRSLTLWFRLADNDSFDDFDRVRCARIGLDTATICLIDGRLDESESWLDQLEDVLTTPSEQPRSLSVNILLAEKNWLLGELAISRHEPDLALVHTDKAIEILNSVLSQEPQESVAKAALLRYSSARERLLTTIGNSRPTSSDVLSDSDVKEQKQHDAELLASIREHRLQNRWDEAEAELRKFEGHLLSTPANLRSIENWQMLADVQFEWAELAIGLDHRDIAYSRYDQSIATLSELYRQQPGRTDIPAALSSRHRLKAWHLSREGRTDSAFVHWDLAIQYAVDDVRHFTRVERVLERALMGDHRGAALEADEVMSQPDLKTDTVVHLARVYAACLTALHQDRQVTPIVHDQHSAAYIQSAMNCLRRVDSSYFADSGRRSDLMADSLLESLRQTEEFANWYRGQ